MINLPQIWIILKEIVGSIITNDAKVWLMGTFFHCGEWEFFLGDCFFPLNSSNTNISNCIKNYL